MPSTTFTTGNVRSSGGGGVDKTLRLKLATDEVVRLVCTEPGPAFAWVHNLRKPRFGIDGKPKMVTIKNEKTGESRVDHDMEFISNPICHGDPDILEEKGYDPGNCLACQAAEDTDYVTKPQRRFAIGVLVYSTKNLGSSALASPFTVAYKVWGLTEKRFAEIVSVFSEFEVDGVFPDPRTKDLILGPCTNAGFQNYAIKAATECAMFTSESNVKFCREVYENNMVPDLAAYCGFKKDRRYLSEDLEDMSTAWEKVRSGGRPMAVPDVSVTELDSSILDTPAPVAAQPASVPEKTEVPAAPQQAAPAASNAPAGALNFEELIASMRPKS